VTAGLVADKSIVVPDTMLESSGIKVVRDEALQKLGATQAAD